MKRLMLQLSAITSIVATVIAVLNTWSASSENIELTTKFYGIVVSLGLLSIILLLVGVAYPNDPQ